MSNELTTTSQLKTLIQSDYVQERFNDVLGKKSQGFIASLLQVASSNLEGVEPKSILNAAMTAATLDLPINQNLGFAYIIPYKGNAQFQLGYKGFIQLAQRSGQFKTLNVSKVCEGEIESEDLLTGDIKFSWIADHDKREKMPAIGYVAYMKLVNGFEKSLYMTVKELETHGLKYSQTMKKGYGLWKDNFDAMAKKTLVKLLLSKYAPLTTQMQKAQLADQAVITGEDEYQYVDNEKLLPEEVSAEKEREKIKKHIENAKTIEELKQLDPENINDKALFDPYDIKKKELENAPKGEVTKPK